MGKASVQAIENDADLNCVSQCDVGVDIKQEIAEKTPDVVLDLILMWCFQMLKPFLSLETCNWYNRFN